MSNNACNAKRHKTKKFSFKRKPIDKNQIGQVAKVQEPQKPVASQPKQAKNQPPEIINPTPETKKPTPETKKSIPETKKSTPEIKKPTPETKKPTPETSKSTSENKKQIPETTNYPECVKICKSQNEKTEIITDNDNVEMVIKTIKLKKLNKIINIGTFVYLIA